MNDVTFPKPAHVNLPPGVDFGDLVRATIAYGKPEEYATAMRPGGFGPRRGDVISTEVYRAAWDATAWR